MDSAIKRLIVSVVIGVIGAAGVIGAVGLTAPQMLAASENPSTPVVRDPTTSQAAKLQLEAIKKKIETADQAARDARKDYSTQEKKLKKLNQQLSDNKKLSHSTRDQVQTLDAEIAQLEKEKQAQTQHIRAQEDWLKSDLIHTYHRGNTSQIALMLNQTHPERAARLIEYAGYVNDARERKIQQLIKDKQTRSELIDEISFKRGSLRDKLTTLKQQEARYFRLKSSQAKLLSRIQGDINSHEKQIARLQADKQHLNNLMRNLVDQETVPLSLADAPFETVKGALSPPVDGEIIQKFGQAQQAGVEMQGVWFDARQGEIVHAVHHGQVIFAQWLRGYGQLVIVDHGDHYYTLYGHNDALLKKPGDWVMSGDPVATSGKGTGLAIDESVSLQSGLYFEIRRNGEAINPAHWLAQH